MIRQQANSRQYLIYAVCTITAWNLLPEGVAEAKKYRWVHDGIRKMHKGEVHWWLLKLMIWLQPLTEEVLLIVGSWEDGPRDVLLCSFSHFFLAAATDRSWRQDTGVDRSLFCQV